ncbi:MAG TPA: hypothetical protein VFT15_11775 [Chitinophagaceae bacterium]|nr:hypothetical protein [Chitinophagaceae bacterium]
MGFGLKVHHENDALLYEECCDVADARTKLSAIFDGIGLLVLVFFVSSFLNRMFYCVLGLIIIRIPVSLRRCERKFVICYSLLHL